MAIHVERDSNRPDLSADDPAQILALLDRALNTPGVTVTKLRLVRHIQEQKVDLDRCTDQDLVTLLDCSERTAREAKQWTRQLFAAMHVCSTPEIQEVQNNNIHGGEDAAAQLARQQLEALDWGMLEGRRVQDLDAFIAQHGAVNVLYAVWCSQGQRIHPPAFVTWWLRQGNLAPDGWLPAELRIPESPALPEPAALAPIERPISEPAEVESPALTPGPVEAPETPTELQPLQTALRARAPGPSGQLPGLV